LIVWKNFWIKQWRDIWAIGRYDLGLNEKDFWRLTFKEFDALVKRLNFRKKEQQYQVASILATLHNVHRTSKSDKIFKPEDFLEEKKQLTNEQLYEKAKLIYMMFKNYNNG